MVLAVIQARMNSSRLPGKVLADVCGEPMLARVIRRVRRSRLLHGIIVATSTEPSDDEIERFCLNRNIDCFRGSEQDVLDRFYRAAIRFGADVIVRITADCPLIDGAIVDKAIEIYFRGDYDYVTNTLRPSYPDGLDVEVLSFRALERSWKEAKLPSDREHVTAFIRRSGIFRLYNFERNGDGLCGSLRWTVDEDRDLDFVRAVYQRLLPSNPDFSHEDVLRLLKEQPDLAGINSGATSNEGYYRSIAADPPVPPLRRSLSRSLGMKARAERLIPSCSQTFSKGPSQYVQGVAPVFIVRGKGCRVWDVDGNQYIDLPMALGPVVLGYCNEAVRRAVSRQMGQGTTFSLPHPMEIEVAERLVEMIPCAEMVRFGKNGSDATAGAIRLARAYTGRDIIACCGYHGWQDWYIGSTSRSLGVPETTKRLTLSFAYNDLEGLERIFAEHPGKVAAVILEPVGVEEPSDRFLHKVLKITHKEGAILIFDEVITGFRISLGGAQRYYGVVPDLACFGKAMANGFPLSAIVGRREIMSLLDRVFFSFTFGGETLSLAAASATIEELQRKRVIEHLWEQGRRLKEGYNVIARELGLDRFTRCIGLPPRTVITFHDENCEESLLLKSLFQQECLSRGVLFSGGQNISLGHSHRDVDKILRVYSSALKMLSEAIRSGDPAAWLKGEPVKPVFRRP